MIIAFHSKLTKQIQQTLESVNMPMYFHIYNIFS